MIKLLKVAAATILTASLSCSTACSTTTSPPAEREAATVDYEGKGVIRLSGAFGYGTAEALRRALDMARNEPEIEIRIDSPGGYVSEGKAVAWVIAAANINPNLKSLTCHVYGRAASAAFFVLQTCPIRTMDLTASLMVHKVHANVGDVDSVGAINAAIRMELLDAELAKVNCGRLKISLEECRAMYATEDKWLNAIEALQIGAVDRIK